MLPYKAKVTADGRLGINSSCSIVMISVPSICVKRSALYLNFDDVTIAQCSRSLGTGISYGSPSRVPAREHRET
jgi:hypothetical protein